MFWLTVVCVRLFPVQIWCCNHTILLHITLLLFITTTALLLQLLFSCVNQSVQHDCVEDIFLLALGSRRSVEIADYKRGSF